MTTKTRRNTVMAVAAAATILLSGCSLLAHETGPARDADGTITETVKADVTTLLPGDCFSFQGDDRGAEPVIATPCSSAHEFRVLQVGAATDAQIAEDGSLQNFMSVDCKEKFTDFAESVTSSTKPELQFLVFEAGDAGPGKADSGAKEDTRQHFSCITTDPAPLDAQG